MSSSVSRAEETWFSIKHEPIEKLLSEDRFKQLFGLYEKLGLEHSFGRAAVHDRTPGDIEVFDAECQRIADCPDDTSAALVQRALNLVADIVDGRLNRGVDHRLENIR